MGSQFWRQKPGQEKSRFANLALITQINYFDSRDKRQLWVKKQRIQIVSSCFPNKSWLSETCITKRCTWWIGWCDCNIRPIGLMIRCSLASLQFESLRSQKDIWQTTSEQKSLFCDQVTFVSHGLCFWLPVNTGLDTTCAANWSTRLTHQRCQMPCLQILPRAAFAEIENEKHKRGKCPIPERTISAISLKT